MASAPSRREQRPVLWCVQGHTFRYGDIVLVQSDGDLPYIAFICDSRDEILSKTDNIKLQWLYRMEDIDPACIERAERRLKYRIVLSREVFWSFHQDVCPVASIMGLQKVFVTTRDPQDIERDVPSDTFVCRHVYDPAMGRIWKLRQTLTKNTQEKKEMQEHIDVASRVHAYPFALVAPKSKSDVKKGAKQRQRISETKVEGTRQSRRVEDPKARAEARLIELALKASLEDCPANTPPPATEGSNSGNDDQKANDDHPAASDRDEATDEMEDASDEAPRCGGSRFQSQAWPADASADAVERTGEWDVRADSGDDDAVDGVATHTIWESVSANVETTIAKHCSTCWPLVCSCASTGAGRGVRSGGGGGVSGRRGSRPHPGEGCHDVL
jgi:hypothetical protein